jgi:hypothetical protein
VSPILVRPVREQLEHDRIIRLLQTRFRRRYEAGMNPGAEQNVAVGSGSSALYPDLVLLSPERGHRLRIVVEVETGESVNHLEALAQWANFSKLRAEFHLYVPSGMVDVARRLCEDNQIHVNEIWSYHTVGDEVRFTLVHRAREAAAPKAKSAASTKPAPKAKTASATRPKPRAAAVKSRGTNAASRSKSAKKPARMSKRK